MDEFDSIWNSITGGANYAPGEQANSSIDWGKYISDIFEINTGSLSPGQEGYGWRYFSDGTAINSTGKKYYFQGKLIYDADNPSTFSELLGGALNNLPKQAGDALKKAVFKEDGSFNVAGLGTLAAAAYGLFGGGNDVKTGGYNEPVPRMTAVRERVPVSDEGRRPGSMGRQYFSDTTFVPEGGDVGAARAAAQQQAQGIASMQQQVPQPAPVQPAPVAMPWAQTAREKMQLEQAPQQEQVPQQEVGMAAGGQVPSFKGPLENNGFVVPGDVVRHADPAGMARKEAGLQALHQQLGAQAIRGPGDAMSDSIPTTIEGRQPAAVANGEAYVPRRKVEELGNGNPKRGADQLYNMMERLRKDRTGSTQQINPDNPQELARAYQGGQVKRFQAGGTTTEAGTSAASTTVKPTSFGTSTASTLSPWVGPYVTEALGQGAALANQPYQAYTGPLTAGPTGMQQQAFAGMQSIAGTGFTPETYSAPAQFNADTAQQYMNPYLMGALEPQLEEMRRQANIARLEDAGRLTRAGAYGGSRQAIMESEGRRNLLDLQRRAIGEGMFGAYERGLNQFNLEQERAQEAQSLGEASRRYSSEFGLKSLGELANLGEQQRAIEQAGLSADKSQFEEEREWAYRMPQYQLGLLQGLPIGAETVTPNTTGLSSLQAQIGDLMGLYDLIAGTTNRPPATSGTQPAPSATT